MRHLEVLVVTPKTTIPKVLNWKVTMVNTAEIAIEKIQQKPYQVIAISSKVNEFENNKLNQIAKLLSKDILVVNFDDVANLSNTIKRAYWTKNKPNTTGNYLDNSFEIKLANSIHLD